MARFGGKVGFIETVDKGYGVWVQEATERLYFGDILKHNVKTHTNGDLNDNFTISNEISILADPFAFERAQYIKYVEFMGAKWNVTNVEVLYPRLLLTLGGVYNGEQAGTA